MKLFNKLSAKIALWLLKKGYASLPNTNEKPYILNVENYHKLNHLDVNTAACYNAEDHGLVNKYFQKINWEHDKAKRSKLIDNYYTQIYRRYNDHLLTHDARFPEIVECGIQRDRVVFDGLERNALLITGKSNRYMTHYAIGAGTNVNTSQVKPGETKVDDEIAREDMRTRGFADAKGSSIAFGVIYGLNVPTAKITNSAVTDGPVDTLSIVYLRTNYIGSNAITITFGQTFGAFTSIIYQRSA
jgi:hypothetical protein